MSDKQDRAISGDVYMFPQTLKVGEKQISRGGLSLRDWFAGQAIGLFSFTDREMEAARRGDLPDHEGVAQFCYRLADAMIEARKREEST